MPGRDGTGPTERGVASGRGLAYCQGTKAVRSTTGLGQGLGSRRGHRNFAADLTVSKTQKELLQEQKAFLESKLDIISKQLQSL
ncbi:DUF5320 domain-containing protein [Desulfosporosinus sp. BG]|uniref:DUF5320 domain-containing protein n=1 Tax=Desulfosporosinus sp. BG TaxID=1633135 RepID=UPI00083A0A17|nr:DUF5320 domain-containing protein [Desulfosporosinus sp. BG]ODA40871.1 hypothetical protein DSBG_2312 [Desulfosporosinus sp. BG]